MKLNNIPIPFFVLLRAGLWSKSPEHECFPLNADVWEQIYFLARKQTVEGLIYDGIMLLPTESLPPKNLLIKWTVLIDSIESRNKQMNEAIEELNNLFLENHITAFLQKGQGLAACYEKPLHRICGDVDWCFQSQSEYDRANQLIRSKGIPTKIQAGYSVAYEWRGFLIEHHSRLLDIHNPFVSSYLAKLQQVEYKNKTALCLGEREVTLFSPLLTHVSVNSHILKHFLSFGIGLRQLCDSARICCAYHDEIDKTLLKEVYCKTGLYRWMCLLNTLLVQELGMPVTYLPFPLSFDSQYGWMMEDIFRGGNFGFYDTRYGFHILRRFLHNVRYVPSEAFWFPVLQIYSRIKNYRNR
ncbi:nucleotidyltransferase family protein [uncultured Bacteroides sp.]|uniref:nucleotidyltransferase family protein n=1 Tax=uncultured Bacteroides sp. TaxID=162156 RepID=UPI002AAB61D2|nr:nucleotidyltransferase family protein [uncultured Bacteroides sp.]